jgi:hypothetical protein
VASAWCFYGCYKRFWNIRFSAASRGVKKHGLYGYYFVNSAVFGASVFKLLAGGGFGIIKKKGENMDYIENETLRMVIILLIPLFVDWVISKIPALKENSLLGLAVAIIQLILDAIKKYIKKD